MRWAWAEVDLDAIRHNVEVVRGVVGAAQVWAVVKADAYGHGAVPVASAAVLTAGASGLCVALVQEGVELRAAGLEVPILVLSEQPPEELGELVAHRLIATVYSPAGINALAGAVSAAGGRRHPVHLKIDTGMHRVGAAPQDGRGLVALINDLDQLDLAGVFTHLAVADAPLAGSNELQLRRFAEVIEAIGPLGNEVLIHAANSAAALALPEARCHLVRLGIAMYGIEPGSGVAELCRDLRPALSLHARVGHVQRVAAGEGVSYGLRHVFEHDATVATVPIGYADGVPRRLFGNGAEVLIHGRRVAVVGVVTMDSLMVDCGDVEVVVGDEVVLIGAQIGRAGRDAVPAEEWAIRLGTIGYEIVCGISRRIERLHQSA